MTKPVLKPEAVTLLREVEQGILANPEFYDQNDWARITPCGTVCCIAGWVDFIVSGSKAHESHARGEWGGFDFRSAASEALGIDLFAVDCLFDNAAFWPGLFCYQYKRACTAKERAQVAVDRIEHFIRTGK